MIKSSNRASKGLSPTADKASTRVPDESRTPSRATGRRKIAAKARGTVPEALPTNRDERGQPWPADKAVRRVPRSSRPPSSADGLQAAAASSSVDQLAELQVRRKFYISAVNKQTNAVKALVRRAIGWRYDTEEGERDKVNGRAARIVAAALNGKEQKPEDADVFSSLSADLAVVGSAIEPMQKARHEVELEMKRAARKLAIFPWAKSVHGFGELGLSVIVAEAGDLSGYPKKGHLWKRLGLAPHDGKAYSTWRMKGGLSADDWTAAGYSPRRRAEVYAVISEPLFRAQSVVSGPYRGIYDRRRAATAIAHEDWTKAHSHMDALRVMTKYLIRDLWVAWRRAIASMPETAIRRLPVAKPLDEREATSTVPAEAQARSPLPSAHQPIA